VPSPKKIGGKWYGSLTAYVLQKVTPEGGEGEDTEGTL